MDAGGCVVTLLVVLRLACVDGRGYEWRLTAVHPHTERDTMPKYLIEREIPGAGNLSPEQLQAISQKSCGVLEGMGPRIQWVQSYVTGDAITCVYIAPNEEMVREHARQGGFPANRVQEIRTIIDPTTAESMGEPSGGIA
jgi:hypothetical protein